jgi:site-specific DNA-cytosine methylase
MVPFTKSKRAQSENDDESWVPGEIAPTQNQFDVGDTRATTVVAECPVQVQWASGGGKVENPTMQALRTSAEHNYQFIRNAMQVRRLTPTECCRLQGFPDDHCDIVYRKKPAAVGPKYRALGNSMAVPCMAWLGWRIHRATGGEK